MRQQIIGSEETNTRSAAFYLSRKMGSLTFMFNAVLHIRTIIAGTCTFIIYKWYVFERVYHFPKGLLFQDSPVHSVFPSQRV